MYTHEEGSRPRAWNSSQLNSSSTPQYTELYFSYSSNLSPQTMKGRHPHSLFAGLAILPNWRWTINSSQFANIVPSPSTNTNGNDETDIVYGALYFITAHDEAGLDDVEGVPIHSQKQSVEVIRINADGSRTEQRVQALVYADSKRLEEGIVAPTYVVWLRKAIREAKPFGLPDDYVDKYIRPHLPDEEEGEAERDMEPVRVMFSRDAFR